MMTNPFRVIGCGRARFMLVPTACCLALAGILLTTSDAAAQPSTELTALYGRGVHAYFSGNSTQAEQYFNQVIQAGSTDPRAYYFRAMVRMNAGRNAAAEADMQIGAAYEASNPGGQHAISRALQRVQGPARRTLEAYRRQARLDRLQQSQQRANQRYEHLQQRGPEVLHQAKPMPLGQPTQIQAPADQPTVVAPNPVATPPASDPFGTPVPVTPSDDPFGNESPEPVAPAPTTPQPAPADDDPFAEPATPAADDDPFGAPMEEEATPTDDPFGDSTPAPVADDEPVDDSAPAPAADDDPFGDDPFGDSVEPAPAADDDPFGDSTPAPEAGDDPIGDSDNSPAPADDDDPFGDADDAPAPADNEPEDEPADDAGSEEMDDDDPFGPFGGTTPPPAANPAGQPGPGQDPAGQVFFALGQWIGSGGQRSIMPTPSFEVEGEVTQADFELGPAEEESPFGDSASVPAAAEDSFDDSPVPPADDNDPFGDSPTPPAAEDDDPFGSAFGDEPPMIESEDADTAFDQDDAASEEEDAATEEESDDPFADDPFGEL